MAYIRPRHDLSAVGWCGPEEVTVVLLDIALIGGCWMPSGAGFSKAAKPELFLPSPLWDEDSENQRLSVCSLAVVK